MDYIRFAINNPVKVSVGVMLVLLFGILAVFAIPVQLVPNVDQPMITVTTTWTGRSPEEVEREIVEEQEDKLKGVTNLRKMTATAALGRSEMSLEFYIGTDMTRALQEVSDKLREVPEYPEDVDQPVITVADSASENAIAWMILTSDDPTFDVATLFDALDKRVKPHMERIEGLAEVNIYGGREREVHVEIDPQRLAERGVTFSELRTALQLENVNVSAGDLPEGRLDVRVRTIGQYDNLEDVKNTIVAQTAGGPVRVRDLGEVKLTYEKIRSFVRSKGQQSIAMNAIRESGANVMSVMALVRERLKEVNEEILPDIAPPGMTLRFEQVYDETVYIEDARQLVTDNLWQGGILTVLVLLIFLRTSRAPLVTVVGVAVLLACVLFLIAFPGTVVWWTVFGLLAVSLLVVLFTSPPTAIIALAIPVSVVGTFVVMTAFGRNLNVISLAGLAFAVGMVVDNAIVVLENTDRHLGMGKSPRRAAYDGAKEVWAAILASTATTLVVFLPVLTLQEEAGQLFRDISLAIMASVGLSLIVAVTVIPAAAARWLHAKNDPKYARDSKLHRRFESAFGIADVLGKFNELFARLIHALTGSVVARLGIVALFTLISIGGAWVLMPPTSYLPAGNRNLVFGIMFTPPGYNVQQNVSIGERVEANVARYWEATTYAETEKFDKAVNFMTGQQSVVPPMDNFFFVSFNNLIFMGASSRDKENVAPLGDLLTMHLNTVPGTFGFAQQTSIFGNGLGGTNSVEVEVAGDDLVQVRAAANALFLKLSGKYRIQPSPGNFNLPGPEVQIKINRVLAADLGINVAELGLGVQALVDGAIIGDYRYQGDSIDMLMVRPPSMNLSPDRLAQVPVAYFDGRQRGTIPLGAVAQVIWTDSPQEIKRIEQRRAVSLTVVPPDTVPLEQATNDIAAVVEEARKAGEIAPGLDVTYAGSADKLVQVREAFLGSWHGWNFQSLRSLLTSRMAIAFLINYLVMAALFESFLYPFVILFSVPLATIGGFMGLAITHAFVPGQLLDVVTMLGFVILLGTVVNNAILIVAQSLNFMRGFGESEQDIIEKMTPRQAIKESVRTRMRPVLMTTLTTLLGMLPLVIKPGSGSELYRGLGSVVLGGLLVSTVFTLLVVPLVFSLCLDAKFWVYRRLGWPIRELGEEESIGN